MNEIKNKIKRLHIIDEYRGFLVLNMIAYHAIWDLVYMFGVDWQWYKSDMTHVWQQWGCWSFILVSGFCWQMGRHAFKRGLTVYAWGIVISLVTLVLMPNARVMFGILTFHGSAMLLMILVDSLCKKVKPVVGAIISFALFLFTYPVNRGYFGLLEQKLISLPREWYANDFTTYLGFAEPGFFSTDYFSLLPWFFLYVTGYFLYGVVFFRKPACGIENCPLVVALQKSICPPLGWVGKHALIIYVVHQPLTYAVLSLWNYFR